jgi:hypothetical protein
MATLLLPQLARESAATNQRVTCAVTAAARGAPELHERQNEGSTNHHRAEGNAREALRYTLGQATAVGDLWKAAIALLQDGLEGNEARALLDTVLEAIASWLGLAKATKDLVQTTLPAGTVPDGWPALENACQNVEECRKVAQDLRDFLNRPRSPVDPVVLEQAREAIAQGRYCDAAAMRSRFGNPRR